VTEPEAKLTGRAAIRWPPRISKGRLRRLYQSIPTGRLDEQLVDDVGISLYMRCRAILTVAEARHGRVLCPVCDRGGREVYIQHDRHMAEEICCPACAWQVSWTDYVLSFQRRQLNQGGAGPAFGRFVEQYPKCRTPWEKMLAIDLVIHEFHYSLRTDPTKPTRAACVNLIEGKLHDVVACLNEISGGSDARPELRQTHEAWQRNCHRAGEWHPR
jgi:hypothetical protein